MSHNDINETRPSERINARLPSDLASHVTQMVGKQFETPSEYIRHLIRQDLEKTKESDVYRAIKEGFDDIQNGAYFKSTGTFENDQKLKG